MFGIGKRKCAKVGHKPPITRYRRIRRTTKSFVAEDWRQIAGFCPRCKEMLVEWHDDKFLDGFSSVSMPREMWDRLREQGYLVMSNH
jgi:hypothetical protein